MPIYAYKCATCGHEKDVLQKISDEPLTVCPSCGAASFSKQVTAAGFQLKGSGWYVTDFRDGGQKKDNGKDKSSSETPPSVEAGSESKAPTQDSANTGSESKTPSAAPAPAPSPATPASPAPAPPPASTK